MLRILGVLLAVLAIARGAAGQSTAFTYQGVLNLDGVPASGPHDFRCRLFDAATGGAQLGPTLCFDNVTVENGAFSIQLDFGQQFRAPTQRHLEILVRPEIGQPCTDDFAYVLLTPRQNLTSTPTSLHANSAFALDAPSNGPENAVFVNNEGKVGIGTTTPGASIGGSKLDIIGGSVVVSNLGDQADLLWLANERSWVFRQEGVGTAAALKLQSVGGGGNKNFIIQTDGSVGIGTTLPTAKLSVNGSLSATAITCSSVSGSLAIIEGVNSSHGIIQGTNLTSGGIGVLGAAGTSFLDRNLIGVHGTSASTDPTSFGVFCTGRLGASGTKSFRIDHPDDPENAYLFHYSSESPEVINFYRGNAVLDSNGVAVVVMPAYFAKINTNPSYQLTAIGAPMPMLHVSKKIRDDALAKGAATAPGVAAPECWFEIAGGEPGGEVSWRVEAVRNDEFVRRFGAPVEVEKTGPAKGTTSVYP